MSTKKSPETIAREIVNKFRYTFPRDISNYDEFESTISEAICDERAKVQKLEKALLFILGQPFDGHWDAQAIFIQDTLKGSGV
jgi:hypothetical protein